MRNFFSGVKVRRIVVIAALGLLTTACPVEPPGGQPPQNPIVPPAAFGGPGSYNLAALEPGDEIPLRGMMGDAAEGGLFPGLTLLEPGGVTTFDWQETYAALLPTPGYVPNEEIGDVFGASDPNSDRRFIHEYTPGTNAIFHQLVQGPEGSETTLWGVETSEGQAPPRFTFSPNGDWVLEERTDSDDFFIHEAVGGTIVYSGFAFGDLPMSSPTFSEDGRHLFYTKYDEESGVGGELVPQTLGVDLDLGSVNERELTPPDLSEIAPVLANLDCVVKDWSAFERLAWTCGQAGQEVTNFTAIATVTSEDDGRNPSVYHESPTGQQASGRYVSPLFLSGDRLALLRFPAPDESAPVQTILFDDTDRSPIDSLAVGAPSPSINIIGLLPFNNLDIYY